MRREIEQVFGIDIKVNSAYEYYIETPVDSNARAFRSWMLDSYAVRNAMSDTRDIAGQIIVDEVPSAGSFSRRSHRLCAIAAWCALLMAVTVVRFLTAT